MQFTLKDGLPFGRGDDPNPQFDVELRELRAGDLIDAEIASEQVKVVDGKATLVSSPALMGNELIRRAVVSVGQIKGPLSLHQLRSLSNVDYTLLVTHFQLLQGLQFEIATDEARRLGR